MILIGGQITRINYPQNFPGRQQKMVYVEFGDEEAMKAGLQRQGEVCRPSLVMSGVLTAARV